MSKKLFWVVMIGVVLFGVLAATRSFWQNPADLTYLRAFIPKVNILPKEPNKQYEKACASCHMLYAPSMLPSHSWAKMMMNLDNHFGDNAEVEKAQETEISEYLQRNAADKVENIYAQAMLELLKEGETPLSISSTSYFKLLHDVVRPEMVSGNPDVMSVARCDICHHEAVGGRFNKFNVKIPNYTHEGKWFKTVAEAK
ncbi:MAG: hypothetical protein R8M46_04445 [Ghiorsea sp.]